MVQFLTRPCVGDGLRAGGGSHGVFDPIRHVVTAGNAIEQPSDIVLGEYAGHLETARHAQIGKAGGFLVFGQTMIERNERKPAVGCSERHEHERGAIGHVDGDARPSGNALIT